MTPEYTLDRLFSKILRGAKVFIVAFRTIVQWHNESPTGHAKLDCHVCSLDVQKILYIYPRAFEIWNYKNDNPVHIINSIPANRFFKMGAVLTSVFYESRRPQAPPFSNSASLHVLVDSLPHLLYTSIGIINNGPPKCPNPFSWYMVVAGSHIHSGIPTLMTWPPVPFSA